MRHSILYFVLQGHFLSENLGVSFLRVAMSKFNLKARLAEKKAQMAGAFLYYFDLI